MENFYKNLKPFYNFLNFMDESNYHPVPNEWSVVITDVVGSTKAIEAGNYKLVNMIGASTIAAISNSLGSLEIPIVFGGDGSTVLIPNSKAEKISTYLRAVQNQSLKEFNLNLRVGIVPIKQLTDLGCQVNVAKFGLKGGPFIAFLKGDGVDKAESLVKSGEYNIEPGDTADISEVLLGLSCRWAPLKNNRGLMLTLLIKSQKNKESLLKDILAKIDSIVDLSSDATHPIKSEKMTAENPLKAARWESKLTNRLSQAQVMLFMGFAWIMRIFNLKSDNTPMRDYVADNPSHSDHKKYDETLRMVIDCTEDMSREILAYLEANFKIGNIFYGAHKSDSALLTCFVQSLEKGKHIHFVDGNDGGYALAAKQLKAQIKSYPAP